MDREALLAMARRHVAEGRDRLGRQRELIARLTLAGHTELLPLAQRLLAEFEAIQAISETGLARASGGSPRQGERGGAATARLRN